MSGQILLGSSGTLEGLTKVVTKFYAGEPVRLNEDCSIDKLNPDDTLLRRIQNVRWQKKGRRYLFIGEIA